MFLDTASSAAGTLYVFNGWPELVFLSKVHITIINFFNNQQG